MLLIRPQQMHSLGLAAGQRFEDRLLAHIRNFFPDVCDRLGEDGTLQAIRHAMDRTRVYRLTTERQIAKYLNLQFVFGLHFDETVPWAAAVLGELEEPASVRMDRLSEKAERYTAEEGD